eukprot:TRINITY_DN2168_c0_g2_i5.p1 TRINITY_DN2168_c0_g2~~TRINITY_DN2168_c0_g2_i5.p1  ORF type:complete len:152 (+),score=29.85 TRINITY_DN2168_c0_g2_i5:103-558(+)
MEKILVYLKELGFDAERSLELAPNLKKERVFTKEDLFAVPDQFVRELGFTIGEYSKTRRALGSSYAVQYSAEEIEEINDLFHDYSGLDSVTPEEVLARLNKKEPIIIRYWQRKPPSKLWSLMKALNVFVDDKEALKNLLIANGYLQGTGWD